MTDDTTANPTPSPGPGPAPDQPAMAPAPTPEPMAPQPMAPQPMAPQPMAPPAPAVQWATPPPAVAVRGQRTALALAAGIVLIVLGVLGGLLGLAVAVLGGSIVGSLNNIGNIPGYNGDPAALATGVVVFVGVLFIVYSVMYLLAGIGVVRGAGWGRVLGIIVGILSGLIWLGGISNNGSGFSLVMLAIHAYIVVVLLFFWRSRPAAA